MNQLQLFMHIFSILRNCYCTDGVAFTRCSVSNLPVKIAITERKGMVFASCLTAVRCAHENCNFWKITRYFAYFLYLFNTFCYL